MSKGSKVAGTENNLPCEKHKYFLSDMAYSTIGSNFP